MRACQSIIILIALAVLLHGDSIAQSVNDASAQKLDEFGDTHADNEEAHLDLLAAALGKDTGARGYIISYTERRVSPGSFLMRIYGYRDYLVNTRGVEPSRVEIIAGGYRDKISTELWLVPKGAAAPRPISELKVVPTSPLLFDVAYPDCPPEFSIHLYELQDALRFYAESLRENPGARSRIIVHPGQRSGLRKATKMARDTKRLLAEKFGIANDKIMASANGRRRECTEVELWIMPVEAAPPTATHNNGMQRTRSTAPLLNSTARARR
jgi:hypothetical protein